ncbi:MAG: hypothetical protein QNK05_08210 [Myxococcota bacterium]|nr:hypothetical protein [Myxococcota bacterium]
MEHRLRRGRRTIAALILSALVLGTGSSCFYSWYMNPRVTRELQEDPGGERAQKVMLLVLPSGRELPVNYLREDSTVYAASDGRWWRELRGEGGRGRVFIQGEWLEGRMRAVEDDPELRESVFGRLRPTAPGFLGTLIVIDLDAGTTSTEEMQ